MVFYSARVCHSTDGEICWVVWGDNESPKFYSSQEALDWCIDNCDRPEYQEL